MAHERNVNIDIFIVFLILCINISFDGYISVDCNKVNLGWYYEIMYVKENNGNDFICPIEYMYCACPTDWATLRVTLLGQAKQNVLKRSNPVMQTFSITFFFHGKIFVLLELQLTDD